MLCSLIVVNLPAVGALVGAEAAAPWGGSIPVAPMAGAFEVSIGIVLALSGGLTGRGKILAQKVIRNCRLVDYGIGRCIMGRAHVSGVHCSEKNVQSLGCKRVVMCYVRDV